MTPSQMLKNRSILEQSPPVPRPEGRPSSDHIIPIAGPPPANGGYKKSFRSQLEPWVEDAFKSGGCPVCGEHILHMVAAIGHRNVSFYTCEAEPREHRWEVVDD